MHSTKCLAHCPGLDVEQFQQKMKLQEMKPLKFEHGYQPKRTIVGTCREEKSYSSFFQMTITWPFRSHRWRSLKPWNYHLEEPGLMTIIFAYPFKPISFGFVLLCISITSHHLHWKLSRFISLQVKWRSKSWWSNPRWKWSQLQKDLDPDNGYMISSKFLKGFMKMSETLFVFGVFILVNFWEHKRIYM